MAKKYKYLIYMIAIPLFAFAVTSVDAEDRGLGMGTFLKFGSGVVSAYLIHEAGHIAVAEATGTHLDWKSGIYNQPFGYTVSNTSDDKGLAVNAAGLLTQLTGSEIILQADGIDKNSAFVRGMMAWNIINPILYSIDYWLIGASNEIAESSYQGDLAGVEYYSDKSTVNGFALSITAFAAFQGYRFLKTQSWMPDWMKFDDHEIDMEAASSDGVMLTYNYYY